MPEKSHWMATGPIPRFPKLEKDLKVDVVVVGGGTTGITAAYLIKKAGKKVALLERDHCAQVDSGHTTAHLTHVTDTRLHTLVRNFGRDHAQAAWEAGRAAIEQVDEIRQRQQISCDFTRVPGFLHASLVDDKDERSSLEEDAKLASELGFDARFIERVPLVDRPGVRFANQALFHPLKYLAGLLPLIPGDGSQVFEHTEPDEFSDNPLSVKVKGHTIRCDYLVIATHVPLTGVTGLIPASLFQTKIASYSSYVLGAKVLRGKYPHASFSDTSDPYYYLRIDGHAGYDYAIFGGADHKTGQKTDPDDCYENLSKVLAKVLPDAEIDRRWTGQVIETNDGLPYIGEIAERQFVATGFSGNGMTFGTVSAMMARDAATGRKNPWQDLFDVHRKKIRGGTWDYLRENKDYPYYMVRDRLAASEGKSLDSLGRGDGKILKIDGQRVAAYRDDKGKVTTLSPVCTHLGCIVHWNPTESTWDCPCHGSRFRATGAVLAGPAESPLEKIDIEEKK
jgi:glycine/D-amino acid oxidase-like deaminating enzyme/nitrite reductase/ring-hydroxylating ferredoxin subunit